MDTRNGEVNSVHHTASGEARDLLVVGQTSQGVEIHATLVRLTRYLAVFEIYNPGLVLRTSEVFSDFKILFRDRAIYAGRAVVRTLVDTGLMIICEASLNANSWMDLEFNSEALWNGKLGDEFSGFMQEWQKLYKVMPEFKIVVADMQSFLSDLRLWLEQVELNVRSQPAGNREEFERNVLQKLRASVLSALDSLFERFEHVATKIEKELQPAHAIYAKRQLHPLVLCAPFMYRTFQKPLGYAGDYEMVNMMVRDAFQGGSAFARMLNLYFLNTPPVVAHRNRLDYLAELLVRETNRVARRGGIAKVLNLGSGPAVEVQAFLAESPSNLNAEFTLLDFNDETVRHAEQALNHIKGKHHRNVQTRVIKKSVHQLLKEHSKSVSKLGNRSYDFVYCAGLFDYLSDHVCETLLSIFYDLVAPGGLTVVTNVDPHNPSRGWMEYVVDWHLFYRNSQEVANLVPKQIPPDATRIIAEPTGVNTFVEIRKPEHA